MIITDNEEFKFFHKGARLLTLLSMEKQMYVNTILSKKL